MLRCGAVNYSKRVSSDGVVAVEAIVATTVRACVIGMASIETQFKKVEISFMSFRSTDGFFVPSETFSSNSSSFCSSLILCSETIRSRSRL